MEQIIDSHVHLLSYRDGEYPWVTAEMAALHGTFLPEQLQPLMERSGVQGCVAVQARQTIDETTWLLDLAAHHPAIRAVVGWVDLLAPDLDRQLERWADQPLLKGFRHVVIDEPDVDYLLRPEVAAGIATLGRHGYTYDLLVLPEQLVGATTVVSRLPRQQFILDHAGLPDIRAGRQAEWESALRGLARCPNVAMKLSGLDFRADWDNWQPPDLHPYLDSALALFGADRLMLGSNWPVCNLSSSYERTLSAVGDYLSSLSETEQAAIRHGTAERSYSL